MLLRVPCPVLDICASESGYPGQDEGLPSPPDISTHGSWLSELGLRERTESAPASLSCHSVDHNESSELSSAPFSPSSPMKEHLVHEIFSCGQFQVILHWGWFKSFRTIIVLEWVCWFVLLLLLLSRSHSHIITRVKIGPTLRKLISKNQQVY
jgi:hypothetical protein